jgi:Ni,Fe-hydrogenase III small subunit
VIQVESVVTGGEDAAVGHVAENLNETRKKEKMVSILNATIGQEPKTAEEILEGTAKIFTLNNENNDGTQK